MSHARVALGPPKNKTLKSMAPLRQSWLIVRRALACRVTPLNAGEAADAGEAAEIDRYAVQPNRGNAGTRNASRWDLAHAVCVCRLPVLVA